MVLNRFRQRYSFHFRVVVWLLAAIFPVAFGFRTTVDAGVFMAIVSLLVALVVTQVLFNDVDVRSQGGSDSTTSGDLSGDEVG